MDGFAPDVRLMRIPPDFFILFAGRVGRLLFYMIRAGGGGRGRIDQKMIPHCLVVFFCCEVFRMKGDKVTSTVV